MERTPALTCRAVLELEGCLDPAGLHGAAGPALPPAAVCPGGLGRAWASTSSSVTGPASLPTGGGGPGAQVRGKLWGTLLPRWPGFLSGDEWGWTTSGRECCRGGGLGALVEARAAPHTSGRGSADTSRPPQATEPGAASWAARLVPSGWEQRRLTTATGWAWELAVHSSSTLCAQGQGQRALQAAHHPLAPAWTFWQLVLARGSTC